MTSLQCSPTAPGPLAVLPMHGLDLSGPSAAAPSSRRAALVAVRPEWAARGYRPWRYIVIHHSSTDCGSAAAFDKMHRARGWDELGYHFVIDNGDGGADGRIEVGRRWKIQKWGAHTGGTPNNEYNNFGIGICLVGDFTKTMPTQTQLAALKDLVIYLMRRYDIPAEDVLGHRDAPNATTDCPGDQLYEYIHGKLRHELLDSASPGRP